MEKHIPDRREHPAAAHPPARHTPFGGHLEGAGVTDTGFARMVNDLARQQKINLALARTTVGHWRHGTHRPRDPRVADLAAAALSGLLGYTLTPADLGWRDGTSGDDIGLDVADSAEGTLRTLAGISARDGQRAFPAGAHDFTAGAYAYPALAALSGVVPPVPDRPTPSGASEAVLRGMAGVLDRNPECRGQVASALHTAARAALDGRPPGRGEVGALGELALLAGAHAAGCGLHGLAQRYLVQALALAEHARDAGLAGRVLAAMAEHASACGHPRRGVALARAAALRREGAGPVLTSSPA